MSENKGRKKSGDRVNENDASKQPNMVRRLGPRNIIIVGLVLVYAILAVAVPPSDPKAIESIFILLLIVIVMVRTDSAFIRFVRGTRTTLGLVAGVTGFGVGVFAWIVSAAVSSALYLMLAVLYLVVFGPLFLYKIAVVHRKGRDYVNPLTLVGVEVLVLSIALFFLSPEPVLSIVVIVLIVLGAWIRGKGVKRETRKEELENIAFPG